MRRSSDAVGTSSFSAQAQDGELPLADQLVAGRATDPQEVERFLGLEGGWKGAKGAQADAGRRRAKLGSCSRIAIFSASSGVAVELMA